MTALQCIWHGPTSVFVGDTFPHTILLFFSAFNIAEVSASSCIPALSFLRSALHMQLLLNTRFSGNQDCLYGQGNQDRSRNGTGLCSKRELKPKLSALTALRKVRNRLPPVHNSKGSLQSVKIYLGSREIKKEESKELPAHLWHSAPALALLQYPASGWREQDSWTDNTELRSQENTATIFAAILNSTYDNGHKARKCFQQSSSKGKLFKKDWWSSL